MVLNPSSDTGFFLDGDTWTCYRRNYFQLTGSFKLINSSDNTSIDTTRDQHGAFLTHVVPTDSNGSSQQFGIKGFLIGCHVTAHNSTRAAVHLLQFTGKRERGEQGIPDAMPCLPSAARNTSPATISNVNADGSAVNESNPKVAIFPRLQFNASTHKGRTQEYYQLRMELYADIGNEQYITVATANSPLLVVRGRGPGHYQNKPAYQTERSGRSTVVTPAPTHSQSPSYDAPNDPYALYKAPSSMPPLTPKYNASQQSVAIANKKLKRKARAPSAPIPEGEIPLYLYQPSSLSSEDNTNKDINSLLSSFHNHTHEFVHLRDPAVSSLSTQLLNAAYGSLKQNEQDEFNDDAPHLYALIPPAGIQQRRLADCLRWINRMIAKFNEEKVDNIVCKCTPFILLCSRTLDDFILAMCSSLLLLSPSAAHLPDNFTWITHAPPTFPWSGQSTTIPDATSRYSSLLTALPGAHLAVERIWLTHQHSPTYNSSGEEVYSNVGEEEVMASMVLSFNSSTAIGDRGSVSVMQSWGGWVDAYVTGALTGATSQSNFCIGFPQERWYVPSRLEEWFDTYSMAEALANNCE